MFRAVENGLPLSVAPSIRLTCWIDAQGRTRQILRPAAASMALALSRPKSHCASRAGEGGRFNRFGDWFAWSCSVLSGGLLLAGLRAVAALT